MSSLYQTTFTLNLAAFCFCSTILRAASAPGGGRSGCQGYRLYLDHGTEMCELCSEICRGAERKGTEEQCQDNCPEYLVSMKCKQSEGWFYDELHGSCRSCCDICYSNPHLRPLCVHKCADFLTQPPTSDQAPPHLHREAATGLLPPLTPPPCAPDGRGRAPHPSPTHPAPVPVWIVIVIITVVIIAVVLGIVVILAAMGIISMTPSVGYKWVWQRVGLRAGRGRGGVERPDAERPGHGDGVERPGAGPYDGGRAGRPGSEGRPVEESTAAVHQSAAIVAADGTIRSMTVAVKTAFADLSMGHDASQPHPV